MNMVAGSRDVFGVLQTISARYPNVEIVVRLKAGNVSIGFPKGPEGDAPEAESRAILTTLCRSPN